MDTLDQGLKDLQTQREKLEAAITDVNEALVKSQNELLEHQTRLNKLATEIATMQAIKDDLTATRQAVETEWKAIPEEIKNVKLFHGELLSKLKAALPEDRQKAIRLSITDVENQLNTHKQLAEKAQVRADTAEADLDKSQERLRAQEAKYNSALTELHNLPGQIQMMRDHLISLQEAAKSASADDTTAPLALFIADEIEKVSTDFESLSDQGRYQSHEEEAFAEWQKYLKLQTEVSEKAVELERVRQSLTDIRAELDKKQEEREADIRRAISSATKSKA